MAVIEEHVCHINDRDGGSFDIWWSYDNTNGDMLSVRWSNSTLWAFNVRVDQPPRQPVVVTLAAGSSGTANVPQKRYNFVRVAGPTGELEWAPSFTFSVYRADATIPPA